MPKATTTRERKGGLGWAGGRARAREKGGSGKGVPVLSTPNIFNSNAIQPIGQVVLVTYQQYMTKLVLLPSMAHLYP
jgi:hypothetical protein